MIGIKLTLNVNDKESVVKSTLYEVEEREGDYQFKSKQDDLRQYFNVTKAQIGKIYITFYSQHRLSFDVTLKFLCEKEENIKEDTKTQLQLIYNALKQRLNDMQLWFTDAEVHIEGLLNESIKDDNTANKTA